MSNAAVAERPATASAPKEAVTAPAVDTTKTQTAAAPAPSKPEESQTTKDIQALKAADPTAARPAALNENAFHLAQFKQNIHYAIVPKGVTLNDAMHRDYWANVAQRLSDMDKIVMVADDRSFYAEAIVLMKAHNWAILRLCFPAMDLAGASRPAAPTAEYEVQDIGLQLGWGVVRKADGAVVLGNGQFRTREQAENAMRDWLKVIKVK